MELSSETLYENDIIDYVNTNMIERLNDLMRKKNWAIMDVEYIQTSRGHRCIRKLYILAKDGFTDRELEFHPCVRYNSMSPQNKRSFHYCKTHIHKLPYYPRVFAYPCNTVLEKIERFINENNIALIKKKVVT